jgi:hypothetical protein
MTEWITVVQITIAYAAKFTLFSAALAANCAAVYAVSDAADGAPTAASTTAAAAYTTATALAPIHNLQVFHNATVIGGTAFLSCNASSWPVNELINYYDYIIYI